MRKTRSLRCWDDVTKEERSKRILHDMVQESKGCFSGVVDSGLLRIQIQSAQATVIIFICPLMSLSLPAMLPPMQVLLLGLLRLFGLCDM